MLLLGHRRQNSTLRPWSQSESGIVRPPTRCSKMAKKGQCRSIPTDARCCCGASLDWPPNPLALVSVTSCDRASDRSREWKRPKMWLMLLMQIEVIMPHQSSFPPLQAAGHYYVARPDQVVVAPAKPQLISRHRMQPEPGMVVLPWQKVFPWNRTLPLCRSRITDYWVVRWHLYFCLWLAKTKRTALSGGAPHFRITLFAVCQGNY